MGRIANKQRIKIKQNAHFNNSGEYFLTLMRVFYKMMLVTVFIW